MSENLSKEENFSTFMSEALYGEDGFYTLGGGAGRTRDYLTSAETGDLFGRVLAQYIDTWYDKYVSDGPAIVLDVGCGPGSLALSIARTNLQCAENIEYCLVDISPAHRETCEKQMSSSQPAFEWSVHETLPECDVPTLVIANELLDNLVFDIARTSEVYQAYKPDRKDVMEFSALFGIFGDVDRLADANIPHNIADFRIPLHVGIAEWFDELAQATAACPSLSIVLFDYIKSVKDFEDEDWLRLYANNERIVGVDNVLAALEADALGDITTDVIKEDMHLLLDRSGFSKISFSTQTEWLLKNDIDIYCQEPSPTSVYDQLEAFAQGNIEPAQQSSFAHERELLLDENGLGAFGVFSAERII